LGEFAEYAGLRLSMILLAKIALGMAGVGLASAGVLCSEGVVYVKVIEKQPQGLHLHVIAPAMLAPIAVHLAPQRDLAKAAREIQPYRPTIRAVLDGLRDSDDVVFVEVKGPGEYVEVAKSGGSIVVDVDDAGETVHVSAPIRVISSTVDQLAAASSVRFFQPPASILASRKSTYFSHLHFPIFASLNS
jgi:hypothetical protein